MKIMVYRDRKYTTMYDYLLKPVLLVPIFWPPSKVQSGWVKSCSLPWSGLKQSPDEAGPARAANLGLLEMTELCRLCAEETTESINIFSSKGQEMCLPEKIQKCLPVVVSTDHFHPVSET